MKKLSLITLTIIFLISACSCTNTQTTSSTTNAAGYYNFPDSYSPETAIDDGCLVIESDDNSSNETITNEDAWQTFLDKSSNGEDAFLRVASFIGSDYCALTDLYYTDGVYYMYEKNEYGIQKVGEYKYLRRLAGMDGIPKKAAHFYVLTDSLELTYNQVRHSFLSSDLSTVTWIPFEWLGFTVYFE